jgi:hypothetical protein
MKQEKWMEFVNHVNSRYLSMERSLLMDFVKAVKKEAFDAGVAFQGTRHDSIWNNAPEDARYALVLFAKEVNGFNRDAGFMHTRELPKSKEEALAEKLVDSVLNEMFTPNKERMLVLFSKVLKENDPS